MMKLIVDEDYVTDPKTNSPSLSLLVVTLDFSGVVPFGQSGWYPVGAEESDEIGDDVNDDRFCRVCNGSFSHKFLHSTSQCLKIVILTSLVSWSSFLS